MSCSNTSCGKYLIKLKDSGQFCVECGFKMKEEVKKVICQGKLDDMSNCQSVLETGQKFCMNCGTKVDIQLFNPVQKDCSNCNARLVPGQRFCGECGQNVQKQSSSTASSTNTINPTRQEVKERLAQMKRQRLEHYMHKDNESSMKKKKKETYRVQFGWLKKFGEKYIYVMPRQGGGAKKEDVPRNATYGDIRRIALNLFSLQDNASYYLSKYNGEPYSSTLNCESFVKGNTFVTYPRIYIVTTTTATGRESGDEIQSTSMTQDSLLHDSGKNVEKCGSPSISKKKQPFVTGKICEQECVSPSIMPLVQPSVMGTIHEQECVSPSIMPLEQPSVTEKIYEQECESPSIMQLEQPSDAAKIDEKQCDVHCPIENDVDDTVKIYVTYTDETLTMDEVNSYIEKIVEEEKYFAINPSECTLKLASSNNTRFTPVHTRNTAVQLFLDYMKGDEKEFQIVESGWGPFVLLNDDDFHSFLSRREEFDMDELTFVCPPIKYYLSLKNIPLEFVSPNVLKVSKYILEEYFNWFEELKMSLNIS